MRSYSAPGSLRVQDVRLTQNRSLVGRISQRVATSLSFAGPPENVGSGTVSGTVVNTLCSVIGAGVLSLPLAMYFSSMVVGLAILLVFSCLAAFSVYCLVVGCDVTGRYSITEVVAFTLFPPLSLEGYLSEQRTANGTEQQHRTHEIMVGTGAPATLQPNMDVSSPGGIDAVRGSIEDGARNIEGGDARGLHISGGAAASCKAQEGPLSALNHRTHQGGKRGHRADAHSCPPERAQRSSDDDADGALASMPTSAMAGWRDAFAREEWRRRRRRRIVTTLMELIVFCSNYGTLVIYTKVIADSMPPVMMSITHTEGLLTSKYFWLAAAGMVFFLLSCARKMEELKWTSLVGFLTIVYIVLLILYRYQTQRRVDYPHVDPEKHGDVRWFQVTFGLLQTASTFGLAFSYHYNVPYFYKELQDRHPRCMMKTIAISFPIIVACYAVTGVFGYLTFGDEVAAAKVGGNIVSNYPKSDFLMNVGRLGLFAHFACAFPVVSICTRRGIHRLLMIALTWAEQSAVMMDAARASGARLTLKGYTVEDFAAPAQASASAGGVVTQVGWPRSDPPLAHESSPLLHHRGSPTTGYKAVPESAVPYPPHHASCSSLSETTSVQNGSASFAAVTANTSTSLAGSGRYGAPQTLFSDHPGTIDADRDVGSPEQTTMLAVVLEAALLVGTTVWIAATVSGIDFVIHLIGTLFSVFIVMVAPGMVGWCVFSLTGPFGSAAAAALAYDDGALSLGSAATYNRDGLVSRFRLIRLKRVLCVVNVVLGFCVTCVGISVVVYDTVRKKPVPVV